ncbi:MAG: RluA family pseudouridine synthase [Planctomycetes bacterium]|nr:RluA family pseudouridine synthase [Planctomycetota bacterium]
MNFEIIYQDDRIVVLNKQAGLLSVPGIGPEKQDCLATRVKAQIPEAKIVHRLDRDTSGVIIMALDAEAHRELSRQFQDREVQKTYIAIVHGQVESDQGEIDLPMRKDMESGSKPLQIIDHAQGRSAVTKYRVIEREADRTRLELMPITGRSHQIRLHLKTISHPILGDDLYAPTEAQAMAERLLLHAEKLWVVHPGTAEPMTFESPCPF